MAKTKGAYARRKTEVKSHQASERRDECRYSNDPSDGKRWISIKGRSAPINPMPETPLRHHLIRECKRYFSDGGNDAIIMNAKAIVREGIDKGLVTEAVDPADTLPVL